jgi:type II secretion system protein N
VKPAFKQRILRIARWAAYPAFYLFALALFGYLTFPYDQLKGRLISEFDRMQERSRRRPGETPMRLEIAELDGYWLTGVEVTGARLIIPPSQKKSRMGGMGMLAGGGDDKPDKPSVLAIDEASVRVHILPLLIGNVFVSFDIAAFGGEIEGSMPVGTSGDVEAELTGVQLSDLTPLRAMLEGLPIMGVLGGELSLSPKEDKFAKADGRLELRIDDVVVADGKTEVMGVKLPAAQIGSIVLEATAKDGVLTIDEMTANGRDLELVGEGKIKLHESWDRSQADIYIKFKFSDAYKDKSDATKSLLGDASGKIKPILELDPRSPFRRAKTDDGYYRFHLSGPLANLVPRPAGKDGAAPGKRSTSRTPRAPTSRFPRLGGGKLGGGMRPMPRVGGEPAEGEDETAAPRIPPSRPVTPPEAAGEPERNPTPDGAGEQQGDDGADDRGAEEQGEEDPGEE